MKKMKKVFLAVLTIAVVTCLFAICSVIGSAETITGTYGDLSYSITDGEVSITACNKNASSEIIIPDTIDGYPVVEVKSGAFLDCTKVTSLVVGRNVKRVGALFTCVDLYHENFDITRKMPLEKIVWNAIDGNAMYSCYETIYGAFEGDCSDAGVEFILGDDVERIPDGLCYGTIIKSITFGDEIKTIGYSAFANCSNLIRFEIPESVTTIEGHAFYQCYDLEVLIISENVKKIEHCAFARCDKLSEIYWNAKNVTSYSIDVIPSGFYMTDGLSLYFGDNLENIPNLLNYDSTDSYPGVKYIYVGYNTHFTVDVDRWLMLENVEYATQCRMHTDMDSNGICDLCHTIISVQTPDIGDNDTDNEDLSNSSTTSFFNSLIEFLNKIIAWIKSLFGLA